MNIRELLPQIEDYEPELIAEAGQRWPAISRYIQLLDRSPQNFADELRLFRHRKWLQCALATYSNRKMAAEICLFWSQAACEILERAWAASGLASAPIALFALGKLGADELNLSSDVDLLYIRQDGANISFRDLRQFQSLITEGTSLGFCLRIDLDLRPGGRGSSTVSSEAEFENHYGYYGETWERLALVRLKPICGDSKLKENIIKKARAFSYRRHLDYTLLDDLKILRPQIHASFHDLPQDQFNLKLGVGGIRDIELFTHALQVIHGGKNLNLRAEQTTRALERLQQEKLIPAEVAQTLLTTYWNFRDIENRLQAKDDQQTYILSQQQMHELNTQLSYEQILSQAQVIDQTVQTLLGRVTKREAKLPADLSAQQQWLRELGFSKNSVEIVWPQLISTTALSRSAQRDEVARLSFLYAFMQQLKEIGMDVDLGMTALFDFSRAIRAKASFFTLFLHEPNLIRDLAWMFSTSPYLGSVLASRPELLDSFIFRRQSLFSGDDFQAFLEELADRRLLSELIASSQFLSHKDVREMTESLSFTADQICQLLLERMNVDLGPSQLAILTLGKWGGRELGLRSDLDFIFLTPQTPSQTEQKIARRFISRMSESHKGGSIYSVDLRLRPSGKAGPILSSQEEFEDYLQNRAEIWERQAYLKARNLGNLTLDVPNTAAARGINESELAELKSIRAALLKPESTFDLKFSLGGLVHIEFAAQAAVLIAKQKLSETSTVAMIRALQSVNSAWHKTGDQIERNYLWLRTLEQMHQLTSQLSGSRIQPASESFQRMAQVLGTSQQKLEADLADKFEENKALLKDLDPLFSSR